MPEFDCQVYWHDLPTRIAPWKDEDERRAVVAVSKQVPGHITPRRNRYFPPSSQRATAVRGRAALAKERSSRVAARSGIHAEPHMTQLSAVNALLDDLGRVPVSVEEAARAVEAVNSSVRESTQTTQGNTQHLFVESPTLQVLRALVEARGLVVTRVEAKDLKAKGRCIHAADLQPQKLALVILDREAPLLAVGLADMPSPFSKDTRPQMHLLVPLQHPHPWWRRVRKVSRIDPNLTVCVYVHHRDVQRAVSASVAATSSGADSATDGEGDGDGDGKAESTHGGGSDARGVASPPRSPRMRDDEVEESRATSEATGGHPRRRRSRPDMSDLQATPTGGSAPGGGGGAPTSSAASLNTSAATQSAEVFTIDSSASSVGPTDYRDGLGWRHLHHTTYDAAEDDAEWQDTKMPKKLRRLEQARTFKVRNLAFSQQHEQQQRMPEDQDDGDGFYGSSAGSPAGGGGGGDPLTRIATVAVQKFRTPKGVVHHWSQRLIERNARNDLYTRLEDQQEDD